MSDKDLPPSEVVDFHKAIHKLSLLSLKFGDFVKAILERKIRPCGMGPKKGLAGLLFRQGEIRDYLNDGLTIKRRGMLSVRKAANVLGVKSYVLYSLIRKKFIEVVREPLYGAEETVRVKQEEIEKFKVAYTFSNHIARTYNISSHRLLFLIMDQGVMPVSGPLIDGGLQYVFKTADLEPLDIPKLISKEKTAKSGKVKESKLLTTKQSAKLVCLSKKEILRFVRSGALNPSFPPVSRRRQGARLYFTRFSVERFKERYIHAPGVLSARETAKMLGEGLSCFYKKWVVTPGQRLTMEGQLRFAHDALSQLTPLLRDDVQLLISHGNGPQVGHMLTRVEQALGAAYALPLEVCVAESEGELGYVLEQALTNVLAQRGQSRRTAVLLTQVVVDANDPAMRRPTKPIGVFYSAQQAETLRQRGFDLAEDAGRGFRRVVPSTEPREVLGCEVIDGLLNDGVLVIAAGGGGIPVIRRAGQLLGVEAVIDKDLLAEQTDRWGNTMAMIGRLKPGVTPEASHAEVRTIAAQLTAESAGRRNAFEGNVKPLRDQVIGRVRPAVWVLAGAVGMVMLIVCANLSHLLLARTATRQKAIAIRTALGAGRWRLVAQLLTEGIVLSCCGAIVGFVLAVTGTRALAGLEAVSIPLLREVRTDVTALAFTLGIALATGLVFGTAVSSLCGWTGGPPR